MVVVGQHDVGMVGWDLQPELNPETGRPRSFMEMSARYASRALVHSGGPAACAEPLRRPARVDARHGAVRAPRLARLEPERAGAVRTFLDRARHEQAELLDGLRGDPVTAPYAEPAVVARNRRLVWTWDSLSLALLLDWAPHDVPEVPAADGAVMLMLQAQAGAPCRLSLEPWPFSTDRVDPRCEGRRLEGRFDDEAEMLAALSQAPWVTVAFELTPREGGRAGGL